MFGNIQDFVDQRSVGGGGGHGASTGGGMSGVGGLVKVGTRPGFRPPTPEEGAGGVSNLLMEIRTRETDPNQRLKAIEAQQKARERERATNKTDEFGDELAGFVQGRKLKKTGGTDAVERSRQRKQEMTIKRMLTGDGSGSGSGSGSAEMGMLSPQATGASMAGSLMSGVGKGVIGREERPLTVREEKD
jgi:hypothetical protein